MKCPNCVLGDLEFVIRGELRFQTDARGRPCGNAEISTSGGVFWMTCDTCSAGFEVQSFGDGELGALVLRELTSDADDSPVELEPKLPPGTERLD